MKLIPKEKLIKNSTDEKLYKMLETIWNDEHFIIGIFAILKTEENKQKFIKEIETHSGGNIAINATDTDLITLAAVDIADGLEI